MPAGISPAGLFTPALAANAPAPSAGSRYVNPATGDYEIDPATGQAAQMPPTRQRVLLALNTVFGSSVAVPDFGLRTPRKIGPRFVGETKAAARSALRHLTREDGPVIRIDAITVDVFSPGKALLTVSYTDLTTGRPDRASRDIR